MYKKRSFASQRSLFRAAPDSSCSQHRGSVPPWMARKRAERHLPGGPRKKRSLEQGDPKGLVSLFLLF